MSCTTALRTQNEPGTRLCDTACAVCQGTTFRALGHLQYALFDDELLDASYPVAACQSCGMVRCQTTSTQADYDRMYAGYQYSSAYLERGVDADEAAYLAEVAATVLEHLPEEQAAVLDVGSGSGSLLHTLRHLEHGALWSCELSAACLAALRDAGFAAEFGSAERLPFPDLQPGCVILNHVLEHVVDLPATMASLRQRLRRGGSLYLEVPDTRRFAEFQPEAPLRFFYPQHVQHFDADSLDNLLRRHGFAKRDGGERIRREKDLALPAVWGVYEVSAAPRRDFRCSFHLADQIQRWLQHPSLDPRGELNELAERQTSVYVWGIGIHVQLLLGMSPLRHCRIACCVDRDHRQQRRTLGGHRILSPEVLQQAGPEDAVLIGSHIHRHQMLDLLRDQIGFRGKAVTV